MLASVLFFCGEARALQDEEAVGPVTEGWTLSLSSAKTEYDAGAAIDIHLSCKNVEKKLLQLGTLRTVKDFYFDVTTFAGAQTPKTAYGKHIEETRNNILSGSFLPLAPGAVRRSSFRLNCLCDLSIPGDYKVTAYRYVRKLKEDGRVKLVSNTLWVKVR